MVYFWSTAVAMRNKIDHTKKLHKNTKNFVKKKNVPICTTLTTFQSNKTTTIKYITVQISQTKTTKCPTVYVLTLWNAGSNITPITEDCV